MTTAAMAAELLRRSARAYGSAALAELQASGRGSLSSLPSTFAAPADDLEVRVLALAESVAVAAPELFADAVGWYRTAFAHREVPDDYLAGSLVALRSALARELPQATPLLEPHFAAGLAVAIAAPVVPPSPLATPGPFVDTARRFLLAALEGRGADALQEIERALAGGASVADLHDHVLVPVQHEVGRMWLLAEAPIADEHFTSQLVGRALERLQRAVPTPPRAAATVLAFAVGGNLHDLGIRLVAQRLELDGLRVTTLGANLPAGDLAWTLADRRFDVLAIAAGMLLHLSSAAQVVRAARAVADPPLVLCGGAPFEIVPDLHTRIGADAVARSAGDACAQVRQLVQRRRGRSA